MKKINIIASMVRNETMADWNSLLEDNDFKNLVIQSLKSKKDIKTIVKTLSNYANNNLV
jgi:hypothetical protein